MKKYDFQEKTMEFSKKAGKEIPVWKTPKFEESKKKAIELIESKKYNLTNGDFWILMNETKTGKMQYTGLIISHNACLKINDKLENKDKFKPSCVMVDKGGYDNSLVFSYCNDEQGIYEVGEVSASNCKNDYKYAMGLKRLFDRVILKLSKIAFEGIYSESESDEFTLRENRALEIIEDDSRKETTLEKQIKSCPTVKELEIIYKKNKDKIRSNPELLELITKTGTMLKKDSTTKKAA